MGACCSNCVIEDMGICEKCIENPKYKMLQNHRQPYKPTCPRGYSGCVNNPAYIKYRHPDWYKELYGDMTPEQAAKFGSAESGQSCYDRLYEDPDEEYYCYDDEDK